MVQSKWHDQHSTAATAAVAKSVGEDRSPGIAKCSATQNVDEPLPHVVKEIFEVIKDVPQGRTSERIAMQTVDVPVPHVGERNP